MVIAAQRLLSNVGQCPHCGSRFIAWDKNDHELFCCICGWRQALRITKDQAREKFKSEKEFWLNLFADKDPDE